MRFAGWGTQLFVMLALGVFGGTRMDKWTDMSFPLFTLLFPFIILMLMIYQLIKDTSKRKSNNEKE
jgi:membrane protein DedA with SNARE-associated domain